MFKPSIAERIKKIRQKHAGGITQIVDRFEIKRGSWYRYETDEYWSNLDCSIEKKFTLLQMSQYFNVDYIWLMTGKIINPVKVLVADDSATSRTIMSLYLRTILGEKAGIIEFSDVAKSLDWAKENHCDLVIADFDFPGDLNGDYLISSLRCNKMYVNTPIIVVTMHGKRVENLCLSVGANEVIYKPISSQRFIDLCLQWLDFDRISNAVN